jgi:glutathione S-transferase
MSNKLVFGYWSIRGLGQPIRYLLKFANVDYTEKTYNFGPAPDFSRHEWLNDKFNLGLAFPNLPYVINGDVKLTQASRILFPTLTLVASFIRLTIIGL